MLARVFTRQWWAALPPQTLLLLSFAPLAVLFVITATAVRGYEHKEEQLAERWYQRGQSELKAGRASDAIESFRTALLYVRGRPEYEESLAQALLANRHAGEARSYLLNMWERHPGSGVVNLQLARVAASQNDPAQAIAYYQNAMYGAWDRDADQHRRAARLELATYMLAHGRAADADSHLAALLAETRNDPDTQLHIASLLMQAGDYRRALEAYANVLTLRRRDPAALAGAGTAAYDLGDYVRAAHYLARAVVTHPGDQQSAALLKNAQQVVALDPFGRFSTAERARRASHIFNLALQAAEDCSQLRGTPLDDPTNSGLLSRLYANAKLVAPGATPARLRRDPDQMTNVIAISYELAEAAAAECPPPPGPQMALLQLANRGVGAER